MGQYSPCPRPEPRPQAQPHRGREGGAAYQAATSRIACEMMPPAGFSTPRAYTDVGHYRPCRRGAQAAPRGLGPIPDLKHGQEPAIGSSVFWRHLGCRFHQPKTVRIFLHRSACGRRHQWQSLEAAHKNEIRSESSLANTRQRRFARPLLLPGVCRGGSVCRCRIAHGHLRWQTAAVVLRVRPTWKTLLRVCPRCVRGPAGIASYLHPNHKTPRLIPPQRGLPQSTFMSFS
jgi:hypothetical protein